ncbi:MAG TPA: toprim domain-containing protein, partial [Gemmata sp.]|nr:toprim domain-containing protein [Gemmata sp.]
SFRFEGGIAEYVVWLNRDEKQLHPPVYVQKSVEYTTESTVVGLKISTEVALQYTTSEEEKVRCYTNNAFNPVGGTHMSGFRSGLTRAINAYGKKEGHFKPELEVRGEDFRAGLTAVVSIGHPDPVFESQTKIRLNNPEVEGIVNSVVYEFLTEYLEKNPKEGKTICQQIALAAELRLAAKKAREALKDRKGILGGGGLPGKLMDCTTRERDKSELFLVEGDSAGGSAESGRDRMYQAVLPLRGKVLNVEKARLDKLLKNNEISALIAATGIDIENVEDVSKVRYGKVIILTDADVDGQHIRTLLLTFFFRQMRKLIEEGHIYVARPPLYKVTQKKEVRFIQTREEMVKELTARGLKDTVLLITKSNPSREVKSNDLEKFLPILAEMDTAVVNLERRGHTLEGFLARGNKEGVLPSYHVRFRGKDEWYHTQADVDNFRAEKSKELGKELVLDDTLTTHKTESGTSTPGTSAAPTPPVDQSVERYTMDEWHEVRTLNRTMGKLRSADFGFEPGDLIPLPRVAGREPPVRFELEHDETRKDLPHLLMLVNEIRKIGEKGISVTRFKGLGEMDPQELWDTTLDPKHRTLLRVTLTDALKAEELFRTLMGEEVEGRKAFIMNRTISNLEDIDYGA